MSGQRQIAALFAGVSIVLMLSAATARADDGPLNALMMGGTAMPTPSDYWQDTIVADYIDPATGQNYTPVLVPTPESAASTSIPVGLANLQAIMDQQPAGQPYLTEGYSQSAQIAIDEKLELTASGNPPPDVTFLLLGSGNRPDGGFLERFAGLVIPGATGFDFNGAEPTDAGITTIDIASQYDGNADFPQYPVNVVADLNAVLGFIYQHAGYGDGPLPYPVPAIWPPSDPLPALSGPYVDEYVLGSTDFVRQVDGDTTFYFIPTTDLPLLDPLRSLGVPEPVLNIFQPALQVVVEAGYDRSIPFGDPTPAELIPTLDPATFTSNSPTASSRAPTTRSNSSAPSCPSSTNWKASSPRRRTGRSSPSGCPTTSSSPSSTPTSTRSRRSSTWKHRSVPVFKTCWISPASNRICSIRFSDSSDRSADYSPADSRIRLPRLPAAP